MSQHSLEIEIDGVLYMVEVEVDWERVDDSFDGHLGGRVHTFEAHHYEPQDWEIIECVDEDAQGIDPHDVPGLVQAIAEQVDGIEYDPD